MTILQSEHDDGRPQWLPSRPLIGFIAALWMAAFAAQTLVWLGH
jgi:hypothetical protein